MTITRESPTPADAKRVDDLIASVADHDACLFKATAEVDGSEPAMFTVALRGEYMNVPMPKLHWSRKLEYLETPRAGGAFLSRIPLSSAPDAHVTLDGDWANLSHYYPLGGALLLVSDAMHRFMELRDPEAFESRPVSLSNDGPTLWLKLPLRVLDAVDVHKTSVSVNRRALFEGQQRIVPKISYPDGFLLRQDIAPGADFFMDRFHATLIWRADAFHAAASTGLYGFFGMSKGRLNSREEVRTSGGPVIR